jgi:phospholipid transport system substrate-binding protein
MIKKISYILLVLFLLNHKVWAKSSIKAEKFVEKIGNDLINIGLNEEKSLEEARQEMVKILAPIIDFDFILKFVVKNYYHQLKAKQKNRLKLAIHDFFINAYSKKFNGYKGEKFIINGSKGKNPYYEVAIIVNSQKVSGINVAFRLRHDKGSGKFKVFDLIVEGISLLQAQKKSFEARINIVGIEDFILELEERILEIQKL